MAKVSDPIKQISSDGLERDDAADVTAAGSAPTAVRGAVILGRSGITRATVGLVMMLSAPALVEKLLEAAIGLTDTVVAGHLPGNSAQVAAATAAVGTMTYLQWFVGIMTSAFGVGATAIVARAVGAGQISAARRAAGTAVAGALLVGLVIAVIFFFGAATVTRLAGLDGLAAVYGTQYLRIMAITICLQTAGQIGMACLRGAGDTFRPMLITGAIALVNGIASPAFTFGWFGAPAWGIQGNAFGTLLAFLVSGVATLALLISGWAGLRLRMLHFRLDFDLLRRILQIGLPSWVEGMLLWIGQFSIVILVINVNDRAIGIHGVTMAAHSAVLRIESLAFLPGFGFGIAASALVGQFLGAGLPRESRRSAFIALRLAFLTMTLAALPMVIIPRLMLAGLVNSPDVIEVGKWPMVLAGLAQPGFAIAIIMSSALRGAGQTIFPMITTILGMFVVRVPILLLLGWLFTRAGHPSWGLIAVWWGIFLDLCFRAALNTVEFLRNKWMHVHV